MDTSLPGEVTSKLLEGITHGPNHKKSEPWLSRINEEETSTSQKADFIWEFLSAMEYKAVGGSEQSPFLPRKRKEPGLRDLFRETRAAQSSPPSYVWLSIHDILHL